MTRKRRALWWTAGVLVALVVGYATAKEVAFNTAWGRAQLLSYGLGMAQSGFGGRGSLRVGTLNSIDGGRIHATDVSLLDTAGVAVVHANELIGAVSIGKLFDKIVHISRLELRGVKLDLRLDFTGPFNLAYIISGGPDKPGLHLPSIGDDIRVDTLILNDAHIDMQYPWAPFQGYKGRARDSVIVLRDSLHDIVKMPSGKMLERRKIVLPRVFAHSMILTAPNHALSSVQIDTLLGTISDPPIKITEAHGAVTWTPDSLHLNLPVVRLPASAASAIGKVAWDQPGPVRYDITLNANASLSDLTWVWDALPVAGTGTSIVRMRTLDDPLNAEYALSKLDVKAMNSHVNGDIAVITRPMDLVLHGVNLTFTPMRSELLRRLSYDAVPETVKGTLRGKLVASVGGPLTAFRVDLLDASFDDDQVAGARSSLRASGLLGFGSTPTATAVRLQDINLDMRSLKPLAPTLPPIDGTLTGSALVNSGDLKQADVSGIALKWMDGAGHESNVSGSIKAQYAGKTPIVNAALELQPLALAAIARIDTTFPLFSSISGKVTASGPLDTLTWTALIANNGGNLNANGTASISHSDWRIDANTEVSAFDVRDWIQKKNVIGTALNGNVEATLRASLGADSVMKIDNAIFGASLSQVAAENRPAFSLVANGALDVARVRIDSAVAKMGGVLFDAHGALARDSAGVDTMSINLRADTLRKVRPDLLRIASMLSPFDTVTANTIRSYATDTLEGDLSASVVLNGSLAAFSANASIGANRVQVSNIVVGLVLGSVQAEGLPKAPKFKASAFVDSIAGLGRLQLASADFEILDANPARGGLSFNVLARDSSALNIRGGYTRVGDSLGIHLDSLRFTYDDVRWANEHPAFLLSTSHTLRMDSLRVQSNKGGVLALNGDIPLDGPVSATLHVERFPAGEAAAFALGTAKLSGLLTGDTKLTGTRLSPLVSWKFVADSVGTPTFVLPPMTSDGNYANKVMTIAARLADTTNHALRVEARLPLDLALQAVPKRLISDAVDGEVTADSVQLDALPIRFQNISNLRGTLNGTFKMTGTMDHPFATGLLTLDGFGANLDALGIQPMNGRLVLRGAPDSLIVDTLRFRTGNKATDTVSATAAVHFPKDAATRMRLAINANNAELSRQRDGTAVDLTGALTASGLLKRPDVDASLVIPRANLFIDPIGAREALDLCSASAQEVIGDIKVPAVETGAKALQNLGKYVNVRSARVRMGDEVWVRTPEAAINVGGELTIATANNGLLALEGEVTANRGVYRLDLGGVVARNFTVDSGRVRFYGNDTSATRFGIYATHVVRVTGGTETPVHVVVAGTKARPTVTLSSDDEVYSGAPESEVISLLMFGAPTFALDGQSQNSVKAVTGILAPKLGGLVEGRLQGLFSYFNTFQVNTAGGQSEIGANRETLASLFDNLSLGVGKQLGNRTFLRVNAGVCRGQLASSNRAVSAWAGVAAEYRIATGLSAQVGVDPGSAPCSRLGTDPMPSLQFGFDLFREWIW